MTSIEKPGALRIGPRDAGWFVLGALLLTLLVLTFRFDRTGRPSLVGDEATYAMQAASLAWDFDLAYSKADYERFVAQWGGPPDGLILQSADGGAHITYGKPFLYALAIAPFVRVAPVQGGLIANAVYLAAAALLAAWSLRRRMGDAAPLWVAVFLFASVSFGYTFWVHADLFLLATTAAGFALVYAAGKPAAAAPAQIFGEDEEETSGHPFLRWFAAGALLAVAGAFRPFYLTLLLPAALAAHAEERRRPALAGLLTGALALLLLTALGQVLSGGSWSGYGGERGGFYPRTGYPEVDFPVSRWSEVLRQWGNTSWLQEGGVDPSYDLKLLGWNSLYFLVGRNVGLLPYFLPLLAGFFAGTRDRGRWAIPLAVGLAVLGFFLLRPFNFYGGGGAIANRYFLPLYPALWFLAGRPLRLPWAVPLLALAGVFLHPLWRHPTAFPIGEDGRYRHVGSVAERWLPYETTQSHIPGGQDFAANGVWIKLLSHSVYRPEGAEALRLVGDNRGEILVGSPEPLHGLALRFGRRAPSRLEVGGRELRPLILHPDGGVTFEVPLDHARAVHPMWWTADDYHLYELDLRLPGAPPVPIELEIRPARGVLIEKSGS
ncbi:MAG TPA: hypothetical protein DD490_01800 [Acidobacteria bacterium]|nr:hypothetical protein [Acidobacteriota bacterium]